MNKVQEFLQKIAEDKTLQEKLTAIMQGKPEEMEEKLTAFAQENEFEFTFDEFLKAVKGQEGEMSDDELDKVAGGYSCESVKTDAANTYETVKGTLQLGTINTGKWMKP